VRLTGTAQTRHCERVPVDRRDAADADLPPWMFLVVLTGCVLPVVVLGAIAVLLHPPLWVGCVLGTALLIATALGLREIARRVARSRPSTDT
jgi:hypothetical protein